MKTPILRALYFPYARSLNEDFLKRSLLYFDELHFVDPLQRAVREQLDVIMRNVGEESIDANPDLKRARAVAVQYRLMDHHYEFLWQKNIVKYVDPLPVVMPYDGLMAQAMLSDARDDEFCDLAASLSAEDKWGILRTKLPASYFAEEAREFSGTRFWRNPTSVRMSGGEPHTDLSFVANSSPFAMAVAHDYIPVAADTQSIST